MNRTQSGARTKLTRPNDSRDAQFNVCSADGLTTNIAARYANPEIARLTNALANSAERLRRSGAPVIYFGVESATPIVVPPIAPIAPPMVAPNSDPSQDPVSDPMRVPAIAPVPAFVMQPDKRKITNRIEKRLFLSICGLFAEPISNSTHGLDPIKRRA